MAPISHAFVKAIHAFAKREAVDLVAFAKGQRKDEVTRERLKGFSRAEGVLYIGTAQERYPENRPRSCSNREPHCPEGPASSPAYANRLA